MDGNAAVPIDSECIQDGGAGLPGDCVAFLACPTVAEEMRPLMPPGAECHVLAFGPHIKPASLKKALQGAVDEVATCVDTSVLGYGLCSVAVVGLKSDSSTLVVPRADECIGIFPGSGEAYREQARAEPGTYYLAKGWNEGADSPSKEYERCVERWGREQADWLMEQMLGNFTRLALRNTRESDIERCRRCARTNGERFGLRYEEISGARTLIEEAIFGPRDENTVVADRGQVIEYSGFKSEHSTTNK